MSSYVVYVFYTTPRGRPPHRPKAPPHRQHHDSDVNTTSPCPRGLGHRFGYGQIYVDCMERPGQKT